jgi:hypothetical protein
MEDKDSADLKSLFRDLLEHDIYDILDSLYCGPRAKKKETISPEIRKACKVLIEEREKSGYDDSSVDNIKDIMKNSDFFLHSMAVFFSMIIGMINEMEGAQNG